MAKPKEIKKTMYKQKCDSCELEIIGWTEGQVIYNLATHKLSKHNGVESK